ncbi:uncharacterized protein LOC111272269 isoform X2 [Varroa jacobsoni]|uniref:uncharacterized protein LOC111272269 isoform X2 n=1 Tax=Varroa jacobsoni TaxID=62625 RepID=UPI000BF29116|nr:uncharacterized protein LOC111272269 isoform X2 [Varroa jacobsoni]
MASVTREPAPSFEELVRALSTRQLPLPRLLRALQIIGRSVKRDPSLVTDLQRLGGVSSLLHYIEKPRVADLALSVLANCLVHARVRAEVLESNGVTSIVRILTNIAEDSIRNRACRALANTALSARGAHYVHQIQGSVHAIVDFLNTTKSKDSQATAMRALRVLGGTSAYRESIASFGGVAALARILLMVAEPLRKPCTEALERLTHKCTLITAKQVKDSGAFPMLVDLSSSMNSALFTMVNIAQLDEMLVDVGSSGIIVKIVTRLASNSEDSNKKLPDGKWEAVFITLCRLCKEPYNLIRVRDSGGLSQLVAVLNAPEKKKLWTYATYTLMSYRHDDTALAELVRLHLLEALVSYLEKYTKENAQDHQIDAESNNGETGEDAVAKPLGSVSNKHEILSDRSSCLSGQSGEHETGILSTTDTETVASVGSDHECNTEESQTKRPKLFCLNSPSYLEIMQARSLAFNYELGANEEYSDYVGLPGYSGMSPRSSRPPAMPDFDEHSSTGSPLSLGSRSTSPCRTEDDASQDAAYSPVYGSTPGSSSSDHEDDGEEKSFNCFRIASEKLHRRQIRRQESEKKRNTDKNERTIGKTAACKRRISEAGKSEIVAPKDIMVDHVLRILEIYTFPRSIDLLAEQATRVCTALLRYIASVPTSLSRAEKVAVMIVQHAMFFRDFLQEDCILETLTILQKAHRKNDCSRCFYLSTVRDQMLQKLSSIAEGGMGSGEIASHLVGDTPARCKEQTALALTFVVRDAQTLYTLLFDCGGMDLLFDILQVSTEALDRKNGFLIKLAKNGGNAQDKEEIETLKSGTKKTSDGIVADIEARFRLAVGALREIGKTCRLVLDKVNLPELDDKVCDAKEILLESDSPEGVTLELDDGKMLTADRKRLCLELSHMLLLGPLETSLGRLVASLMLYQRDVVTVYPRVALFEGNASSLRPRCVAMLLAKNDGPLTPVAETFRTLLRGAFGGHFLDDIRTAVKVALLRKGS